MAFCFLNNVTSMLYEIPISSTNSKQKTILAIAIIFLLGSGLYAVIAGAWSNMTWYYFGGASLFFGIYLWVYQTGKDYTLLLSSILMILVAAACYLLSVGTFHDSHNLVILANIVGVAEGWALIWALYVLGQLMIYKFDMSRKSQNIFFFIAAIVLIIIRILSPSFNGKISIVHFIGFLLMTVILLILMFTEQRKSFFT